MCVLKMDPHCLWLAEVHHCVSYINSCCVFIPLFGNPSGCSKDLLTWRLHCSVCSVFVLTLLQPFALLWWTVTVSQIVRGWRHGGFQKLRGCSSVLWSCWWIKVQSWWSCVLSPFVTRFCEILTLWSCLWSFLGSCSFFFSGHFLGHPYCLFLLLFCFVL